MHTLHWIAVEAESEEQAYETVRAALTESSFASWSDWHVAGGGRWHSKGDQYQYEDDPSDVVSYKKDPDKFIEIVNGIVLRRQNALLDLMKYMKQSPETILYECRQKFMRNDIWPSPIIEQDTLNMPLYYLNRLVSILNDDYTSESGLYDLVDYSASIKQLRERMLNEEASQKQYLVPVDFHF